MVAKIVWDSSFETGIAEIDAQHQQLVRIINDLANGIGHASRETLAQIVEQLKDYAKYHFQFEEKLMDTHNYHEAKQHQTEHLEFTDQILLFDLDVILSSDGLAWDMFHYLKGWLTNHILQTDMRFAFSLRS